MLSRRQVVGWLQRTAALMEENRERLTDLDAAIGDADHGINMDRGFRRVLEAIGKAEDRDIGAILKTAAMALIGSVGGASGPLYGTLLLRAAAAAGARQELGPEDTAAALRAGLEGVMQRGQAGPGDKTMVDALAPAVEALERVVREGRTLQAALEAAAEAARAGAEGTVPMQARRGRASYLGERSVGHRDPGATSAWLMLRALAEAAGGPPTGWSAGWSASSW